VTSNHVAVTQLSCRQNLPTIAPSRESSNLPNPLASCEIPPSRIQIKYEFYARFRITLLLLKPMAVGMPHFHGLIWVTGNPDLSILRHRVQNGEDLANRMIQSEEECEMGPETNAPSTKDHESDGEDSSKRQSSCPVANRLFGRDLQSLCLGIE
jgi:hypothetical protein